MFSGCVNGIFVGRWWQLFWGGEVVCFSVFARSGVWQAFSRLGF